MAGHRRQGAPVRGDAPRLVQRAEQFQQMTGLRKVGRGRRCEPGEPLRVAFAPGGGVQYGARQVGLEYLRHPRGRHPGLRGAAPEPVAHARRHASRPAAALVGHILADAHRLQAAEGVLRVEYHPPAEAAVHHNAHTLDGERRFGDGRRQHDLAAACRTRRDGRPLLLRREQPVEWINFLAASFQQLRAAPDLPLARQESQDVPLLLPLRHADLPGHAFRHILRCSVFGGIFYLHREHPAGAFQQRCLQRGADGGRVDGGRHQHDLQVGPEELLCFTGQGQGHVALQASLVEFVENHDVHTFQRRVVHQHPRQDTFGEHLNACGCTDAAFEADAVSHRPAHRFAQQEGHPLRDLPRRQPPRLQHQNLAAGVQIWRFCTPQGFFGGVGV